MSPKLKLLAAVVAVLAFIASTATAQRCGQEANVGGHNGAVMECPNNMCCGAGGYCGIGVTYCGKGCQSGNCYDLPRCGKDFGGARCPNNYCCSWDGYCGLGSKYCNTDFLYFLGIKCGGCQIDYGRCCGAKKCGGANGDCPDNQCCAGGECGTGPKYCGADAGCTGGPCVKSLDKVCDAGANKCTNNYCCGTPYGPGNSTHLCGLGRDYCCPACLATTKDCDAGTDCIGASCGQAATAGQLDITCPAP